MLNTLVPFFANRSVGWFGGVMIVIISLYLLLVPVTQEVGAYETFYIALEQFKLGNNPFANYGHDLYKYSPTFLMFPLYILGVFPILLGAVIWQALSLGLYYFAWSKLLPHLTMKKAATSLFSILFIFYILSDLVINGTHTQSNTLLVAGIILAVGLYINKQFVLAAIVLAYFTNMKIIPLALMLLLFLDGNKKFILTSVLSHLVYAGMVFVVLDASLAKELYQGWWEALLVDKEISFGPFVHFYLSFRPFLEANFGFIWGSSYFIFVLANAFLLAVAVLAGRLKNGVKTAFSKEQILIIFSLALLFMLAFNGRTEGPTIVLMAPVYIISLWFLHHLVDGKQKKYGQITLFLMFLLISQSTSDLFKGTIIHELSWEHNLRFVGILLMYLFYVYVLFKFPTIKALKSK